MNHPPNILHEIKHRYTGAVLFALECDSLRTCVEAAARSSVSLRGADLRGADLHGVADVILAGDPNGWIAFGWRRNGVLRVRVGCRDFSLAIGREYWRDKDDRREVMAALDYIEAVARLRGWPEAAAQEEAQ